MDDGWEAFVWRHRLRMQPSNANPLSWRWMALYYKYVMARRPESAERYRPMLRLVEQLAESPLADRFRASLAMDDLIIALKPRREIGPNDPALLVTSQWKTLDFRVEHHRGEGNGRLVSACVVDGDGLRDCVEELIARVWPDDR